MEQKNIPLMKVNGTPPDDFPDQVIVMDRDLVIRHPDKVFYLRLKVADGVDIVNLDNAITPIDARKMAREMGYNPTHWMTTKDIRPMMF